jgi:Ca2+-binding EF-hand superfamily protein
VNIRHFLLLGLLLSAPSLAAEADAPASGVEENIRKMDKDHDGMVSLAEIRDYLEKQNDNGKRKDLLSELSVQAESRSCASPFSRSFY